MNITIGNKSLSVPLLQGGMGVGVSRGRLAGTVAKCGGMGVISSAQIGFDEHDFETNCQTANCNALRHHIALAKKIASGHGMVGVNVMHALQDYPLHVRTAVEAGADAIICGAGLPLELPALVEGSSVLIAPIVSSKRAADIIFRIWKKKYSRLPDFLIVEGPKAGGHLGFHPEELSDIDAMDYDAEISSIVSYVKEVCTSNPCSIPVFAAGGIMNSEDVAHLLSLGVDGVQVASRFVATKECDASDAYKEAYCNASKEDITIIKSPVGMPGRALCNHFVEETRMHALPVSKCFRCINGCNPAHTPYCITKALIDAVTGDVENGLIFCGANIEQIHEITTVADVIHDLFPSHDMSYS